MIEWWIYKNCEDCIYYRYLNIGQGVCVFDQESEYVEPSNVCKEYVENKKAQTSD